MVEELLASPVIRDIEHILRDPSPTAMNLATFSRCRNYLIFRVLLANGQRSGVLLAITPESIERARVTPEGAVITVCRTLTSEIKCSPVR